MPWRDTPSVKGVREGQGQGAVLYVGVREGFSETVAFEGGGGRIHVDKEGETAEDTACAKALRQEVLGVFVLEEQQGGQSG